MDSIGFVTILTIEEAIVAAVANLLRAGRDFRELPEHEGRFIVLGRSSLYGSYELFCLKKDDKRNFYTLSEDGKSL